MDGKKVKVRFAHDLMNLKSGPFTESGDGYGSVSGYGEVNVGRKGEEEKDDCETGVYTEKEKVMEAISSTNTMQASGSVMDEISKNLFKGAEKDSNKIVVLLTDGEIEKFSKRVEELRRMKEEGGVRVVSIGVGGNVDPVQLMALASNDASWLDYYIFNYFPEAPSKQKVEHLENLEAFFLHKTPQFPHHHHHHHHHPHHHVFKAYTGTKFTYRGNMNKILMSLCR